MHWWSLREYGIVACFGMSDLMIGSVLFMVLIGYRAQYEV